MLGLINAVFVIYIRFGREDRLIFVFGDHHGKEKKICIDPVGDLNFAQLYYSVNVFL